jgi:hypothetical protein
LSIPTILYLLMSAVRLQRKGNAEKGAVRVALATALLGTGCVFAIIPLSVEDVPGTLNHLKASYTPARYGLPYLSCAVCGMAVLVTDLIANAGSSERNSTTGRTARLVEFAWFSLGAVALAYQAAIQMKNGAAGPLSDRILLGLVIAGPIPGILAAASFFPGARTGIKYASIVTAVVMFATAVGFLSSRWHAGYAAHFDSFLRTAVFSDLEARGGGPHGGICVLDVRPYPFFGSHREWHVVQPRRVSTCGGLADYANRDGVGFVAARLDITGPVERYNNAIPCLLQSPDRYRLLKRDYLYELFSTRRGESPENLPLDGQSPDPSDLSPINGK